MSNDSINDNDDSTNAPQDSEKNTPGVKGAQNKKPKSALDTLLSATDEVMDAVQQFSDRFTFKGTMFSIRDALGKDAEVTVAIPQGGTGEVVIGLGKALHNYPARGYSSTFEFKRGTRVYVKELANQTLLVEPYSTD